MSSVNNPSFEYRSSFELSVVDRGWRRASLSAAGELDLAAADVLALLLTQQVEAGRRFVRLDMSAVTFLDCACLEVLVSAHHRYIAAHGTIVLTGVGAPVTRLLKLTGLDGTLFTTAAVTDPRDQDPAVMPSSKACVHPAAHWSMPRPTPTAVRA